MTRIFLLLLALHCSCADTGALTRFEQSRGKMGTEFRLVLYSPDGGLAQRAFDDAWLRIDELENRLSDYRSTSEVCMLSRTSDADAPGAPTRVSEDLWRVLSRADEIAQSSSGAFDVTVGPFVKLWRRALRQDQLPSTERLGQASLAVGHEHLELSPEHRTARLMRRGMRLDLGGIAKGYALDEVLQLLHEHGIESALVDGGGDIAVSGAPPGSAGWTVVLQPRESLEGRGRSSATTLILEHCAVATSGDTYRFVDLGGVRYSHLIDPATGLGLTSRVAVSVIAADATTADACASAACVLGVQRGLEWFEILPGVEGRYWPSEKEPEGPCDSSGFTRRMVVPPAP